VPNPYPSKFLELVAGQRPGAVVLDLGSGGRSLPGVVSLEWVEHPDNTLRGDCLNLPFRDGCADLILSQAVIEHVKDPQRAFDEMRRVLRPGGLLYVEVAFMQPVHQAPHHYFNVTPHGLAYLLRDWEVLEQGTVGTPDEVLDWLERAYGTNRGRREYGRSGRFSSAVPRARYELAASGVSALARRPVG
jgi:SAM-dependent methyltransferase